MKYAAILILLFFTTRLSAQRLNGVVLDSTSKQPVAGVTVFTKKFATVTTESGIFSLGNVHAHDTVTILLLGYKTYKFMVADGVRPFSTLIYLAPDIALLNEVAIKGKRNFKKDSLNNRREFASTFAYKPKNITNVYIPKSRYVNSSYHNNTTEIASINLLSVINLFKSDRKAKLQKVLLRDEEDNYIYRIFSKEKVTQLTQLKGDSLLDFMARYRPNIFQAEQMTEYDMIAYIKKSYADFIKPAHK